MPSWRVLFAICDSGKKVLQLRHFQVNIILHWQLQYDSISQRIREVHTNDHTRLRNTSYTTREHIFETDYCNGGVIFVLQFEFDSEILFSILLMVGGVFCG